MNRAKKKKGSASEKEAVRTGPGRPTRSLGAGRKGQIAVGLSEAERAELDEYAAKKSLSSSEVVRIALRKMKVITSPTVA